MKCCISMLSIKLALLLILQEFICRCNMAMDQSGLFALEPLGRNKCKMIQLKVHHKGSSINKTCLNKPERNHENNSSAWLWKSQTGLTLISLTSGTVKMAEKLLSASFLVQVDQSPECRNVYRDTSSIKIRNRVTITVSSYDVVRNSLQVDSRLC